MDDKLRPPSVKRGTKVATPPEERDGKSGGGILWFVALWRVKAGGKRGKREKGSVMPGKRTLYMGKEAVWKEEVRTTTGGIGAKVGGDCQGGGKPREKNHRNR